MYIVNPIRKLYTTLISKILNGKKTTNNRLVLYRLDKDNVFISDKRNLSGITIGTHKDHIDAMSIEFYQHLKMLKLVRGLVNRTRCYESNRRIGDGRDNINNCTSTLLSRVVIT